MQVSVGANVEQPTNPKKTESKLTEQGKDAIAILTQDADRVGDVSVSTADQNVGDDGGCQSHSTAGENRKESGELHS
jgi:hypothetical protein